MGLSTAPESTAQETLDRRSDAAVLGALLVVQLSFSGLHVAGKLALVTIPPMALASLRVLFAVPALSLLAARRRGPGASLSLLPRLALLGLLGVFVNQVLLINGLKLTTATNAAILMPTIPVFAVAIGHLTGIERVGRRRLAGVALAVAGSLVVLDPGRFRLDPASLLGDLMVLINCLSYGAFLVAQRPVLRRLPWQTTLSWAFFFGALGVVPLGWRDLAALEAASLSPTVIASVAFILLFPTLIAYSLNSWAIGRSSPTLAAAFTTLQPPLTAALALPLLGELPGAGQILGFLLIAGGLWLVSWRPS